MLDRGPHGLTELTIAMRRAVISLRNQTVQNTLMPGLECVGIYTKSNVSTEKAGVEEICNKAEISGHNFCG